MPETVGVADFKYQSVMELYNKGQMLDKERSGYMDGQESFYQNYFRYIAGYVREYSWFDAPEGGETLKRNIQAIDRCFYSGSVEEIMENLRRENSVFSRRCLEQMERNSMLSMKLALKMIRMARNLCYKGCLENEINVALNKIQDKEFDLGVKEVLLKPGKHGTSPKFDRNISED